ncbi:MAG: isochorismate synthase [Akkermansiaceae bacterium]|nr:isochorismate synthase [Akkermansiaceae bacterium]
MLDSWHMQDIPLQQIDALCRRHCAFALYALPGAEICFCMQKDGGITNGCKGDGFVLAEYDKQPHLIHRELTVPPAPDTFGLLPPPTPSFPETARAEYHRLFEQYTAQLRGESPLRKLVLARMEDVPAPDFSPAEAFMQLHRTAPGAFNCLFHTPQGGTWLCSTPELLLRQEGDIWHTMALAGTRADNSQPWDAKNLREHALVAEHITACLSAVASEIECDGPHTVTAGRMLEHLCTHIRFRMAAEHLPTLLHTLPPTPAVSGFPAAEARAFIRRHEDIPRSYYAGYLGPISEQSTHLYVTLRCMQLFPALCRLYAGGGLMPDSTEKSEWAETALKMQTMRALIQA